MATWGVTLGTYDIGTEAAISAVKIISQRRLIQSPVLRSDMTIIPEGKQKPLKINLKGTVAGSDYTSTRTALAELRGAVESTVQNFTIDDDRYARVVSQGFDYAFVTTDFANYNAKFLAELPYFLASTAMSDIQATPTSGVTYPIGGAGDVPVPLKIVIDANEVGTIADAIQFENITEGTLLKYRGTLTQTQQLIIDLGYDNNNKPKYTVTLDGVNAMSAFEGDFLQVMEGTNWLELTGSVALTVSVYWRDGYYS